MNAITPCFATVGKILEHMPSSWLELTTHRLDIYDEAQAKSQFLAQLQVLVAQEQFSRQDLEQLPTAYDYIRLGHQLSSVLEWLLAQVNQLAVDQVISFDSCTMPILALLRFNQLANKTTHIYYQGDQCPLIDLTRLRQVYGYQLNLHALAAGQKVPSHPQDTVILVAEQGFEQPLTEMADVDVTIKIDNDTGSLVFIHTEQAPQLVKAVQHVRRRETIAMTPVNAYRVLQQLVNGQVNEVEKVEPQQLKLVHDCIQANTGSSVTPLVASSGLSIQYAILMGLVENAQVKYPGKTIAIMLPPNCYGGTNDQARRIAELIDNVEIVDLPVDSGSNLVDSLQIALFSAAVEDRAPIVLAEIPTNPRVEVPDMHRLASVFAQPRTTQTGQQAIPPVFMVDQTFCPNVKLLDQNSELVQTQVVSFSSGSKFPSGGRCIAGYCAVNDVASELQPLIAAHLHLSDNQATNHQLNTLAENMPSMPERIQIAFEHTKVLVEHIRKTLANAKINFVSDQLANAGFTPSVFSLDLPTQGETPQEHEKHKRELNQSLIDHMIGHHPLDCKYCVSYGQLKGCYWTIPATSTQGTTKESDKDYIVRVALSPDVDVDMLCSSFTQFCRQQNLI